MAGVKQQNLGSLMLYPEIFRALLNIKIAKSMLCNLRSISQSYYSNFNSIYLKRVNTTMDIKLYLEPGKTEGQSLVSTINRVGKLVKITNESWKEQEIFAYIFNSISIVFHDSRKLETQKSENFVQIYPMISSLMPYITVLNLCYFFILDECRDPCEILFIKKFINLKNVKLTYYSHYNITSLQEQLETFVNSLSPTIHITIEYTLTYAQEETHTLCTKILMKSNVCFVIKVFEDKEFLDLLSNYKELISNKIKIVLCLSAPDVIQLERVTNICLEYQKYIGRFIMTLHLRPFMNNDQALLARACIRKLSSIMTDLNLLQFFGVNENYDILRDAPQWPKLTWLRITGYTHSLDMLKGCPKLKFLILNVNFESCIFHNQENIFFTSATTIQDIRNTKNENVMEYFSGLNKLWYFAIKHPPFSTGILKLTSEFHK